MKRCMRLAAALLAVCLLPLMGLGEQHSITQVREQAAAGWHQTYTAHGRTIAVDVPILVPEVERLPVLRARSLHPSAHAPAQRPGVGPAPAEAGICLTNTPRVFIHDKQDKRLAPPAPPRNLRVFTQSWYAPGLEEDRAYALHNPSTIRDAQAFLMAVVGQYFPETSPAFLPGWLMAGVDARVMDPETGLVKGKVWPGFTGGLSIWFYQALREVPLLGTVEMAYKLPSLEGDSPVFPPALGARVSLRNLAPGDVRRHLERAVLTLVEETRALAEDVPLCPFPQVLEAYERLILDGRLRRVDSLTLGYVGWYDRQAPEHLTLLPCWVLQGLLYADARATGLLEGTAYPLMDEERSLLLVNAQTGELIDPWRTDKNRSFDLPKLILWR